MPVNLGISTFSVFWYSSPKVVELFLARPVSNILNIFGYSTFYDNDIIFYQDYDSGILSQVQIGEACSGIHSISLMSIAVAIHLITFYRKLDFKVLAIFFIGIILSYFANIFRMAIIIAIGTHYGNEALNWAHSNLGIFIFILWFSFFYSFLSNFLVRETPA